MPPKKRKYQMVTDEQGQRHKLEMFNGARGFEVRFAASCTGCHESNEGQEFEGTPFHPVHKVALGGGCHECLGRGWVMRREWVPLNGQEFEKSCAHYELVDPNDEDTDDHSE